jgi:hypothetical protein
MFLRCVFQNLASQVILASLLELLLEINAFLRVDVARRPEEQVDLHVHEASATRGQRLSSLGAAR